MNVDADLSRWIADGLEGDELITPAELLQAIAAGEFQVLRYPKGCVVWRVTQHFGRLRLLVFLISGRDLDEWKEQATADLAAIARALGITVIDSYSRLGLIKMLKPVGWKQEAAVLRLRLQ